VEMLAWLEMLEETHGKYPAWGQLQKRWEERRKEKVSVVDRATSPPPSTLPPSYTPTPLSPRLSPVPPVVA
jgi:hypothetical protein